MLSILPELTVIEWVLGFAGGTLQWDGNNRAEKTEARKTNSCFFVYDAHGVSGENIEISIPASRTAKGVLLGTRQPPRTFFSGASPISGAFAVEVTSGPPT